MHPFLGGELGEGHLVEAERSHLAEAIRVVVDQCGAVGEDGLVDVVSVAAQIPGDVADGSGVAAHLFGHPATHPIRRRVPPGRDPWLVLGPGAHLEARLRAAEPALVPDEPHRTTPDRHVDELDDGAVLHVGDDTAALAADRALDQLDVHPERSVSNVFDVQDRHSRQTDERQTAGANSLWLHEGSPL
ncbi:MAG: hypothetical protein WCI12_02430 [Actinomycetes bacterium]